MLIFTRIIFFGLVVLLFISCKKEIVIENEDHFIEQTEQLSALKTEISAAGSQFIEVQWNAVNNTHFKAVTYAVYLDNQKIIDGLTTTKYSLINLTAGKKYAIKIVAIAKEGKQTEQTVEANTLGGATGNLPGIYREYSIHNYSRMNQSMSIKKLADGGHLVVGILQHPGHFDDDIFKVIYFRTDDVGNMLWYRLLSVKAFNVSIYDKLGLTSNKGDQEGLLFMQNSAIKFATSNGEVLLQKNYQDYIPLQGFHTIFYASPQQVIAGTSLGSLMSINPEDLSVKWHQPNTNRLGSILAINVDSKSNIYYILRDQKDTDKVYMCNAKGEFLKDFLSDSNSPDADNFGYWIGALLIDEQDNLYLFGRNSSAKFRYFKFSAAGTLLKKNLAADHLNANSVFFNGKDEIAVVGQVDGGGLNTYAGLYVFDKDLNIKSKLYYREIQPHILRGISGNADGSYNIFFHYMLTYTYDNPNLVFIKTGTDGKI